MKRKFIPTEESFARWKKDPELTASYDAPEAEFTSPPPSSRPAAKPT